MRSTLSYLRNQRGAQAIEFVAVLPLFFLMVVVVWQFAVAAGAQMTAEAAAMDGARVAITDDDAGNVQTAVNNVAGGYDGVSVETNDAGEHVTVTVTLQVPLLHNNMFDTSALSLSVDGDVTLRKEDRDENGE